MAAILLAYSNEAQLRTLTWILESEQHCCIAARTSTEAQKLFWERSFDLVILQDEIGVESGIALAESLKHIRNVPILMYSDKSGLKRSGHVDSVLIWPQEAKTLFRKIDHLLASALPRPKPEITLTVADAQAPAQKVNARAPTFIRKANETGSLDSICSECYLMVGSGDEARLSRLERDHRCFQQVFSEE